jgi:site-specific recombinase XerD
MQTIAEIKTIRGRKWSLSEKVWHIPFIENYEEVLNKQFTGKLLFKKKITEPEQKNSMQNFPPEYLETLKLKNYSEPTIKTYRQYFQRFLNFYPNTKLEDITHEQIRKYLLYLVEEKNYSTSAQNQAINAIKFYFHEVAIREIDDYYLPRPKKEKSLPQILNEQEVSKILKSVADIRSKCMIFLIYSAGLTPSEVIYLKVIDVDSKKMQIFISSADGKNDRYVILSKKLLNLLREYFKQYKPKHWLFEKSNGIQFSKRTMQKQFQNAVIESGIKKPATLTILKNSFAVHLIEKGVDIRYVQQMLGHRDSKTTMRYLKVSKRDMNAIQSPLDNLDV